MLRGIPLIVFAVACSSSPSSQAHTTGDAGTTEQELARIEREWGDALGRGDTAFFNRVMADDFLQTGDAKTGTKQDFMKDVSRPPSGNLRYELSETMIRQYGSAAVVTGLVTFPAVHRKTRYTEVWTKESGQWRVHHAHYNDLPAADGSKRGADGDTLDIYLHHVAPGARKACEQWMAEVWEPAFRKSGDAWAPQPACGRGGARPASHASGPGRQLHLRVPVRPHAVGHRRGSRNFPRNLPRTGRLLEGRGRPRGQAIPVAHPARRGAHAGAAALLSAGRQRAPVAGLGRSDASAGPMSASTRHRSSSGQSSTRVRATRCWNSSCCCRAAANDGGRAFRDGPGRRAWRPRARARSSVPSNKRASDGQRQPAHAR